MTEKECPKCGNYSINPTHEFCTQCGVKMELLKVCACGQTMLKHWNNCPKCGAPK